MLRNARVSDIKDVHLFMGDQCNVRCAMCYQPQHGLAHNMPAVLYREHLLPLYPHLHTVNMQGGEPTIMANCRDLVCFLEHFPQIRFEFATNGICIDDFWMDVFKNKTNFMKFSIHAAHKETYDRIVRHGDFDRVIKNIRRLTGARNGPHPVIALTSVLIKHNVREMAEFVALGADLGVDRVKFSVDPTLSFSGVSARQVRIELDRARAVIERTGMFVKGLNVVARYVRHPWDEAGLKREKDACVCPFVSLTVDHAGDVGICGYSGRIIGNTYRSGLEEILMSRQREYFQEEARSGRHRWCPPYCPNNPSPKKRTQWSRYLYLVRRDPVGFLANVAHRIYKACR